SDMTESPTAQAPHEYWISSQGCIKLTSYPLTPAEAAVRVTPTKVVRSKRGGDMGSFRTILCGILLSVAAFSQTSQISGVVRDATGSVIPGAAVKATQTATGVV